MEDIKKLYKGAVVKKLSMLLVLSLVLIGLALLSTVQGASSVGIKDVLRLLGSSLFPNSILAPDDLVEKVVIQLRLPRVLLAIITGISLAGAGAVMQGILRNPLVSPYTLGMSGGASFGAALAIVFGNTVLSSSFKIIGVYLLPASAFLFGFLTIMMVYGIARWRGTAPETLILAGVALGYLFSAGVSALKYIAPHDALRDLVIWLMGGLWGATWEQVGLLAPLVISCMIILMFFAWDMNALAAGEEVATNLGINLRRLRLTTLIVSALGASATVAFTGVIGFIGLVAPHISRMLIGSDNRFLIPCSCLMGAIILLASDTLARTILAPAEIPVGIITAAIGVPFFLYLLLKRTRS
ncbi:MAG: iron ABC transporter permease [Desulfitobacterium sp.]|nr:iron ABC transporter permease [Desulfitobacterium sp.]